VVAFRGGFPLAYLGPRPREKCGSGVSLTLCAAVLCRLDREQKRDAIFCISDRMLTLGDALEYETKNQTKAFALGPANAIALFAGGSSQHFSVITKTHQQSREQNATDIQAVWPVVSAEPDRV
jgi:hypothetical protein